MLAHSGALFFEPLSSSAERDTQSDPHANAERCTRLWRGAANLEQMQAHTSRFIA
jgi:hypothetical protein